MDRRAAVLGALQGHQAVTRGREAVSPERAPPLASPLSSPLASFLPLWPSKHFASGTLNLSPGGEGLIEALPLPTQGPPLIFIGNGHASLHLSYRAIAKKHPSASSCPLDLNIYRTRGGRSWALSQILHLAPGHSPPPSPLQRLGYLSLDPGRSQSSH